MAALILALALFAAAFAAHLAWWRLRLPRRHTFALLGVFAATPAAAAALWLALGAPALLPAAALPAVLALYAGAAGCYLIAYSGVEQTSPSLVLVRALEEAGASGCSRAELDRLVTEDAFVKPRLEALRLDGILGPDGALTPRGLFAARLAAALAAIFGIRGHG